MIDPSTKDNEVILSIEDRGEGISSEIIDNITTPFFTTKEEVKEEKVEKCRNKKLLLLFT